LIFSLLSIQSPQRVSDYVKHQLYNCHIDADFLQQQVLKHNVIERDKVLVPPHWDSWGKIRVLREGFDVEGINSGWSVDISPHVEEPESEGGAVEVYEDVIKESKRGETEGIALLNKNGGKVIEVPAVDTQEFLATQLEVLEARAAEEKAARGGKEDKNNQNHGSGERVIEHVGPVQFNVGGIQVDAENMLERLKVSIDILSCATFANIRQIGERS
jgi:dynein light intermediate chain 1